MGADSESTKGGCCSAEAFWQQTLPGSTLAPKLYTKGGQWKCSLCLGTVTIALGAAVLALSSSSKEHHIVYSPEENSTTFTLEEDMPAPVYMYYELNNWYGNYRKFGESRDNFLVGTSLMRYACDDAETQADVQEIRTKDPYFQKIVSASGEENLRPCGLVALAMFTDKYVLDQDGSQVELDSSDIAWPKDIDYLSKKMEFNGPNITIDGQKSWVTEGSLQHFAVWYRTPASPVTRNLWAVINTGLIAGKKYTLHYVENSAVWQDWQVEKKVVFATLGGFGGRNDFLGFASIVWGVLLVLSGLGWLAHPAPSIDEKSSKVTESNDTWANPR